MNKDDPSGKPEGFFVEVMLCSERKKDVENAQVFRARKHDAVQKDGIENKPGGDVYINCKIVSFGILYTGGSIPGNASGTDH